MAKVDKSGTVTLQELLVTSLAQTDAVAKLLIERGSGGGSGLGVAGPRYARHR